MLSAFSLSSSIPQEAEAGLCSDRAPALRDDAMAGLRLGQMGQKASFDMREDGLSCFNTVLPAHKCAHGNTAKLL